MHLAVHLRRRRLVEARLGLHPADRLEHARDAEPVDVAGRDRHRPRVADEALRREVVDLIGLRGLHRVVERALVGHLAGEQRDAVEDVVDALGRRRRGAAHEAEDVVALVEQQLGEVGAVLAGDAGDECSLRHGDSLSKAVRGTGDCSG